MNDYDDDMTIEKMAAQYALTLPEENQRGFNDFIAQFANSVRQDCIYSFYYDVINEIYHFVDNKFGEKYRDRLCNRIKSAMQERFGVEEGDEDIRRTVTNKNEDENK